MLQFSQSNVPSRYSRSVHIHGPYCSKFVRISSAGIVPPLLSSTSSGRQQHPVHAVNDGPSASVDSPGTRLPPRKQSAGTIATTAQLLLCQAPVLQAPLQDKQIAEFRFWHDEKRFRGCGDASLAQHVLLAAGGTRVGGNFKAAKAQGAMGWQVPDRWDVLWSTSDGALKAAAFVKPGQLVSTLPGMDCLTKKRHLAVTMADAYGEAAWGMLPRTYSIPAQLQQFRQRLVEEATAMAAAEAEAAMTHQTATATAASTVGLITGFYVLKTGEHLGQGLQIVPSCKALSTLLQRNKPYLTPPAANKQQVLSNTTVTSNASAVNASTTQTTVSSTHSRSTAQTSSAEAAAKPARPFICVQQYITNPLLIHGRKFGLRMWVLVLGPRPFRAYMYCNGLVLFSTEQYNENMDMAAVANAAEHGHVTNAAQNQSGDVWHLQQLLDLIGPVAAETLQQQLHETARKVVAAADGSVAQAAKELNLPDGTCAFELLGLDFLIDGNLHPWLLEVNASPSMAWDHDNHDTATRMRQVKTEMLIDMVALLRLQDRYPVQHQHVQKQQQLAQRQHPPQALASDQQHLQQQQEQHAWNQGTSNKQQQQPENHQQASRQHTGAFLQASSQQYSSIGMVQRGASSVNPLLVQADSARYFAERPDVLRMVMDNADMLCAALEVAPSRAQVQQMVQQEVLQQQQQECGLQQQQQKIDCGIDSPTSCCRVGSLLESCSSEQQLVELTAERQSSRGWNVLFPL